MDTDTAETKPTSLNILGNTFLLTELEQLTRHKLADSSMSTAEKEANYFYFLASALAELTRRDLIDTSDAKDDDEQVESESEEKHDFVDITNIALNLTKSETDDHFRGLSDYELENFNVRNLEYYPDLENHSSFIASLKNAFDRFSDHELELLEDRYGGRSESDLALDTKISYVDMLKASHEGDGQSELAPRTWGFPSPITKFKVLINKHPKFTNIGNKAIHKAVKVVIFKPKPSKHHIFRRDIDGSNPELTALPESPVSAVIPQPEAPEPEDSKPEDSKQPDNEYDYDYETDCGIPCQEPVCEAPCPEPVCAPCPAPEEVCTPEWDYVQKATVNYRTEPYTCKVKGCKTVMVDKDECYYKTVHKTRQEACTVKKMIKVKEPCCKTVMKPVQVPYTTYVCKEFKVPCTKTVKCTKQVPSTRCVTKQFKVPCCKTVMKKFPVQSCKMVDKVVCVDATKQVQYQCKVPCTKTVKCPQEICETKYQTKYKTECYKKEYEAKVYKESCTLPCKQTECQTACAPVCGTQNYCGVNSCN